PDATVRHTVIDVQRAVGPGVYPGGKYHLRHHALTFRRQPRRQDALRAAIAYLPRVLRIQEQHLRAIRPPLLTPLDDAPVDTVIDQQPAVVHAHRRRAAPHFEPLPALLRSRQQVVLAEDDALARRDRVQRRIAQPHAGATGQRARTS